jgi:hypothetical protein
MIISASRRTDMPAFYADWVIQRLRAGYCTVPNPFNREQVSRISLTPQDVDAIVFWTRNPQPLMPYLDELDARGYRYYFLFTLLGNPRQLDPKCPPLETSVATFRALAQRLGPLRVIWRYDPLVFTQLTSPRFHRDNFRRLADALSGCTRRCIISILQMYRKLQRRLKVLENTPAAVQSCPLEEYESLLRDLARIAQAHGLDLVSCAQEMDLQSFGIRPGKCVDDEWIATNLGIQVSSRKDPAQRAACGCVVSRDIGMYDSCLHGCVYCYATQSFEQSRKYFATHDPHSPSLLGWYDVAASDKDMMV